MEYQRIEAGDGLGCGTMVFDYDPAFAERGTTIRHHKKINGQLQRCIGERKLGLGLTSGRGGLIDCLQNEVWVHGIDAFAIDFNGK